MKIITSWDDGDVLDLRMAELLEKYKIPAIFFIPIFNTEITSRQLIDISNNPLFEIGSHTLTHPILRDIEGKQAWNEISTSKIELEELIQKDVKSFCYPRGRYNADIISMVKKAGYVYARTTHVFNIYEKKGINLEAKPTIHAYNGRKEYNGEHWLKLAKMYFDKAKEINGLFHVWGHSKEVNRDNEWENLEELFKYIEQNR